MSDAVLVTGAAGFIGSRLVERLLTSGVHVTGLDILDDWYSIDEKQLRINSLLKLEGFEFRQMDVRAVDSTFLRPFGSVIHLAARPGVQSSWAGGFSTVVEKNILATQCLFEASLAAGVRRIVFASSSSVYGQEAGIGGSRQVRPVSPYGVSKAACEQLAHVYNGRGLPVVSLRFFTVYGPGQRPDMAIRRLIEATLPGSRRFEMRGSGEQAREFTFVDDVVEAAVLAMELNEPASHYDIGGGSSATLNQIVDIVGRTVGANPRIDRTALPPGDPDSTVADIRPFNAATGWSPHVSLESGIAREVEWLSARDLSVGDRDLEGLRR